MKHTDNSARALKHLLKHPILAASSAVLLLASFVGVSLCLTSGFSSVKLPDTTPIEKEANRNIAVSSYEPYIRGRIRIGDDDLQAVNSDSSRSSVGFFSREVDLTNFSANSAVLKIDSLISASDAERTCGFTLLYGAFPTGRDEIAISDLHLDLLENIGLNNPDGTSVPKEQIAGNPSSLIGAEIDGYKVTGIVDTGFDSKQLEGHYDDSKYLSRFLSGTISGAGIISDAEASELAQINSIRSDVEIPYRSEANAVGYSISSQLSDYYVPLSGSKTGEGIVVNPHTYMGLVDLEEDYGLDWERQNQEEAIVVPKKFIYGASSDLLADSLSDFRDFFSDLDNFAWDYAVNTYLDDALADTYCTSIIDSYLPVFGYTSEDEVPSEAKVNILSFGLKDTLERATLNPLLTIDSPVAEEIFSCVESQMTEMLNYYMDLYPGFFEPETLTLKDAGGNSREVRIEGFSVTDAMSIDSETAKELLVDYSSDFDGVFIGKQSSKAATSKLLDKIEKQAGMDIEFQTPDTLSGYAREGSTAVTALYYTLWALIWATTVAVVSIYLIRTSKDSAYSVTRELKLENSSARNLSLQLSGFTAAALLILYGLGEAVSALVALGINNSIISSYGFIRSYPIYSIGFESGLISFGVALVLAAVVFLAAHLINRNESKALSRAEELENKEEEKN